jgi:hypothetical protein
MKPTRNKGRRSTKHKNTNALLPPTTTITTTTTTT